MAIVSQASSDINSSSRSGIIPPNFVPRERIPHTVYVPISLTAQSAKRNLVFLIRTNAWVLRLLCDHDFDSAAVSGSIRSDPTRKPIAPSSVNRTETVTASMFGGPGK